MQHCCTVPPLKRMVHIGCVPPFHPLTTQLTPKPTLHPMLCLVQPSGVSRRMCMRYTAWCKLALLTMAKHLQDKEGILLLKSAECVQVSALLLTRWVELFSLSNDPIEALLKNKKKSVHPGPLGQLKPLEEVLLRYIFKQCKQGIKISTLSTIVGASNLSSKFGKKDFLVRCSTIKRFLRAHLLVYQMGTHVCQHKPEKDKAEASNFMCLIRPLLFGPHRNRHFILNMDQTPVYFLMSTKKTLELVKKKELSISAHQRTIQGRQPWL
jgi:hypothetical protein